MSKQVNNFKPGDKVTLKSKEELIALGAIQNSYHNFRMKDTGYALIREMMKHTGSILTIGKVDTVYNRYILNESDLSWQDWMLKPAEDVW